MDARALIAAQKFHRLAADAASRGGFWVSAGGGTANAVADEIALATGCSFDDAQRALDAAATPVWGTGNWYQAMADAQPWPIDYFFADDEALGRWDAREIARRACGLEN